MKYDESQKTRSQPAMKVVRGQVASLESSKGFYRGSRSSRTMQTPHTLKSVKTIKINKNK